MSSSGHVAGATLVETLMATAVIALIAAGLTMAFIAMQKNFAATRDYAMNHADEMRISDYLALDLRRALSVQIAGTGNSTRVTLTIPNYYDSNGKARMPVIKSNGTVEYVDTTPATPVSEVTVSYYLSGAAMIREEGGVRQQLAVNVQDFQLTVLDSATSTNPSQDFNLPVMLAGKVAQVKTRISFNPTFRNVPANVAATKATTFYNTTLMRNTRRDYSGMGIY